MRRRCAFWVAGSAVGTGVVVLPDSGVRLVSLSSDHGPSALDSLGVVLLLIAWLPVATALPRLWREASSDLRQISLLLGLTGAASLPAAIGLDLGWWWLASVAALLVAQVLLVVAGIRRGSE